MRERLAEAARAAAPVLEDLHRHGVNLSSLGDLSESGFDIRPALPILLEWLPILENSDVRETIIRGLTDRAARPRAAPVLIEEFRRTDDAQSPHLKWLIGNALERVVDDSVIDDVLDLVLDRVHGRGRQMLVVALGRSRDPRCVATLIRLTDDAEVAGHALMALKRLAPPEARGVIERFLHDENTWYRREAQKALQRIDAKMRTQAN